MNVDPISVRLIKFKLACIDIAPNMPKSPLAMNPIIFPLAFINCARLESDDTEAMLIITFHLPSILSIVDKVFLFYEG